MYAIRCLPICMFLIAFTAVSHAGSFENYTAAAKKGPHLKVDEVLFWGGKGVESFNAGGQQANGDIVVFGNVWGPDLPKAPYRVIGKGRHTGKAAVMGKGSKARPSEASAAGVILVFSKDLSKVKDAIRFDWDVAHIGHGVLGPKGRYAYVLGRAHKHFASMCSSRVPSRPDAGKGADAYVAKIDLKKGKVAWAQLLKGHGSPSPAGKVTALWRLWLDDEGATYCELNGLNRIAPDGRSMTKLTPDGMGGRHGVRAVDPRDGSFYVGGERNSNTGREPWRQPFLYHHTPEGKRAWKLYDWSPKLVGTDKYRLVSDSACRSSDIGEDGVLCIAGWSDGGNSVFNRQPTNLDEHAPKAKLGWSFHGMKGANGFGWIIRVDPKTRKTLTKTMWAGFVPQNFPKPRYRGAPNYAKIDEVRVLTDGSPAFTGAAATGLIQTPGAFYTYPEEGGSVGGSFVAVLSKECDKLRYSSYLLGLDAPRVVPLDKGLLVVSRAGSDQAPARKGQALSGRFDGHLIRLK